jgi:hypothetical protein
MLENLLIAVESESQVIDIARVSGFMQKARTLCPICLRRATDSKIGSQWRHMKMGCKYAFFSVFLAVHHSISSASTDSNCSILQPSVYYAPWSHDINLKVFYYWIFDFVIAQLQQYQAGTSSGAKSWKFLV